LDIHTVFKRSDQLHVDNLMENADIIRQPMMQESDVADVELQNPKDVQQVDCKII